MPYRCKACGSDMVGEWINPDGTTHVVGVLTVKADATDEEVKRVLAMGITDLKASIWQAIYQAREGAANGAEGDRAAPPAGLGQTQGSAQLLREGPGE